MTGNPDLLEFIADKSFSVAIFDLDSTLVDLNVEWGPLKDYLKKKHEELFGTSQDFTRLLVGLENVRNERGSDKYELFSNIIAEWEIQAAKTRAVELRHQTEVLMNLKKEGKKIAVFTGNFKEAAEIALKRFHLLKNVDFIVGRRESPKLKPDPSGLKVILARFGIPSEDAIYIGDADVDREAGAAAGIPTFILS